jgi:hypothetical protein
VQVVVINRHIIARNRKTGAAEPPIRVSKGKHGKPTYYSTITFSGPGRLVYDPANPLPCGATAWLELDDETRSPPKRARSLPKRVGGKQSG